MYQSNGTIYKPVGCGNSHAVGFSKEYVGAMVRFTHYKHDGPQWGFYLPHIGLYRSNVIRFILTISLNGYDLQAQLGFRYKKVR